MLPTLNGRIQTRVFLLLVVGGIWTLLLTPVLPLGAPLGASYRLREEMVVDQADPRLRGVSQHFVAAPVTLEAGEPPLDGKRNAAMAQSQLQACELGRLVDRSVGQPPPVARAPEPRDFAERVAKAGLA